MFIQKNEINIYQWSTSLIHYSFSSAPILTVAIEVLPYNKISWVEDSDAPGGRRLTFSGYVDNIVKYFAKAMNFTYV